MFLLLTSDDSKNFISHHFLILLEDRFRELCCFLIQHCVSSVAPFGLIYSFAFVSSSRYINIPNIYELWKPMRLTATGNISHQTLALSSLHGASVRAYLLPPPPIPSPTDTRSAQSLTVDLRGAVSSDGIPMSIRNTAFRGATNAKSHPGGR